MIVALPSNHALAKRGKAQSVALASLANDPFILIGPQGTGLHDETVAACRAAGFMPKLGQPAPRITSTLSLVAAGLGIAVIPSTMQSVRISGIIYRRLRPPVPKAFLGLAFRRSDPSPVLKQFLSVVRAIAKSSHAIQ
jgi:DNA-binding transcriptional LysR family regulator